MIVIDRDELLEKLNVFRDKEHGNKHFLFGIESCKELTEDMPTIDIVHCGECKHADCSGTVVYCMVWAWHHGMGQDGFCGYGERESE